VALPSKLAPELENLWPYLSSEGYVPRSIATERYNCIAFAADDQSINWWPAANKLDGYWPIAKREVTLSCFKEAFGSVGYEECHDGSLEESFEKIAIYVFNGEPTHAAKQIPDGRWKSKLGFEEDIEHNTVKAVEDDCCYGKAVQYMKREIK
jgi:hypothetical protein